MANEFIARKGLISEGDLYVKQTTHLEGDAYVYDTIGSTQFASGFAGYGTRIYQNADGKWVYDLDELTVRGRMRVYELLLNQLRATNGSVWVSSTGKANIVSGGFKDLASAGLTTHLPLDSIYNTNKTKDTSAFGYEATITSATVTQAGKFGPALSFNGTSAYVNLSQVILTSGQDEYTTSVWVRRAAGGGGADGRRFVFETTGAGSPWIANLWVESGATPKFTTSTPNGATVAGTTTVAENTWYFVTVTYKKNLASTGLKLYVNGVLEAQGTTGNDAVVITGLNIGTYRSADNRWFSGIIEDFRLYNRILSEDEIANLYAMGNQTNYPSTGLVAYYNFNDGSTTNVYDYTGNGNLITGGNIVSTISLLDTSYGKAYTFNGTRNLITPISGTQFASGAFATVSMWAQWVTGAANMIMGNSLIHTSNQRTYIGIETGKWSIAYGSTAWSGARSTATAVNGAWVHLVGVYGGGKAELYVNGVLADTATATDFNMTNPWTIGSSATSIFSGGYLEDFKFYNRALSQDEITALYNSRGGIRIDTSPDSNHGFLVGDLIRAQRFTGNDIYKSDLVVSYSAGLNTFYAEPIALANPSIDLPRPGYEYVRLGNVYDTTRQGAVYMTADDSGAPFMDVINGIDSFADFNTFATVKARLGNLSGITDTTVGLTGSTIYGLYTDSIYAKGNLVVGGTVNTITLQPNTIAIGKIAAAGANSAIKISNNGTAAESGIFGYNSSGNEVFALRLNSTASIAGWSFDNQALYTGTKVTSAGYATNNGDITISSSIGISMKNFYVDIATGNAYFRGDISAASGTFTGNLSIGSGESIFKADSNGIYLGSATFANAEFSVTPAGYLKTVSGEIAGWAINTTSVQKQINANGFVTLGSIISGSSSSTNAGISIYINDGYYADAAARANKVKVMRFGAVPTYADAAQHTGTIAEFGIQVAKWNSGGTAYENAFYIGGSTAVIAGWDFNATTLYKGTDIVLDAANKRISLNNGAMLFGFAAGGTGNHGIYLDANNYWYSDDRFQIGGTQGISYAGSGTINIGTNTVISGSLTVGALPNMPNDAYLAEYWGLDAKTAANTTIINSNRGSRNLTATGTTLGVSTDSPAGGAVTFAGGVTSGSYLQLSSSYSLNLSTGASVSFWMKWDDTVKEDAAKADKRMRILQRDGVAGSYSFLDTRISGGFFSFAGERDTNSENWGAITSDIAADTTWHHFVITSSGTTDTLYIDGVTKTGWTYTRSGASTTVTIHSIGRGYGSSNATYGDFFKGSLSEIRFYTKALTLNEVKALYLSPSGNKSTKISGDQITTGAIISNTWTTTIGSRLDLDAGTIQLGGSNGYTSSNGVLIEGATAKFAVGNASGEYLRFNHTAGKLEIVSTGFTLSTPNLIVSSTPYISMGTTPPTAANAGTGIFMNGAGLYALNANAVRAQILQDGSGYLGAGGTLAWTNAGVVTISGFTVDSSRFSWNSKLYFGNNLNAVETTSGAFIGFWNNVADPILRVRGANGEAAYIYAETNGAYFRAHPPTSTTGANVVVGNLTRYLSGNPVRYGIKVYHGADTSTPHFAVYTDSAGNNAIATIAGWNFDTTTLSNNNISIVSGTNPYIAWGSGVTAYATGTGIWIGSDSGTFKSRIGNPSGSRMQWTGSQLEIYDGANAKQFETVAGGIRVGGGTNGWDITTGAITAVGTGVIQTSVTANTGIKITSAEGIRGFNGTVQTINIGTNGAGWLGLTGTQAISWNTAGAVTIAGWAATATTFSSGTVTISSATNAQYVGVGAATYGARGIFAGHSMLSITTPTQVVATGTTTVTVTVASTAGWAAGDVVIVASASGTEQTKLNGTWAIATVVNATSFTMVVGSTVAAGTYTTTLGTWTKGSWVLSAGNSASTQRMLWNGTNFEIYNNSNQLVFSSTASGATVGGWDIGTTISATNITLNPGAANTANITVGTGSTAGGLNSAAVGTDVIFWGGNTFANRASAPFRVLANGDTRVGTLTGVDPNTTNRGFYVSANGDFLLKASSTADAHYLLFNGTGLAIVSPQFTLTAAGVATFSGSIQIGSGESVFKADTNGIYLGNETFASAEFRVTPAGALTATSATLSSATINGNTSITGTLSVSGTTTLAGWNLETNKIYNGRSALTTGTGVYIGTDGIALGATASPAEFSVTSAGALVTTSAHIGGTTNGWQVGAGTITAIGTGLIRTASTTTRVEINSAGLKAYQAGTQTTEINSDGSGWFGLTGTRAISWTTSGTVTIAGWAATASQFSSNNALVTISAATATPKISLGSGTYGGHGIFLGLTGASLTVTNVIGAASTTVTVTVASTSGYYVGEVIYVTGATGTEQTKLNGIWTIASVPNGTTFTMVVGSSVAAGTLTTTLGTWTKSSWKFSAANSATTQRVLWTGNVFEIYNASNALVFASNATGASIGGWTISNSALYSGSKTAWNDTNAGVHLSSSGIGIGNNVFTVNGSTGALTATSATVTGTINASGGYIGGTTSGWAITSNTLASTGITLTHNATAASASIRLGSATALTTGMGVWIDGAGNFRAGLPNAGLTFTASNAKTVLGASTEINGNVWISAPNTANRSLYLLLDNNVTDSSGNGVTVTNNNSVTFVTGVYGNTTGAADFNGSTQFLSILSSVTALRPVSTSMTVTGFFKFDGSMFGNTRQLWGNHVSGSNSGFGLILQPSGQFDVKVGYGGGVATISTSGLALSTGVWYHIAVVYDQVTVSQPVTIYINGNVVATGNSSTSSISWDTGRNFAIGAGITGTNTAQSYFDGQIDSFAFYQRVLTQAEIARLAFGGQMNWAAADGIGLGFDESGWGIIGRSSSNTVFRLGSTNNIAGWTFDSNRLFNYDSNGGLEFSATNKFIKLYNNNGTTDSVIINTSTAAPTLTSRYTTIGTLSLTFNEGYNQTGTLLNGGTGYLDLGDNIAKNVTFTLTISKTGIIDGADTVNVVILVESSDDNTFATNHSSYYLVMDQYLSNLEDNATWPKVYTFEEVVARRYVRVVVTDLDFNAFTGTSTLTFSYELKKFNPVVHLNPGGVSVYGAESAAKQTFIGSTITAGESLRVGASVFIPYIKTVSGATYVSITSSGELVKEPPSSIIYKKNVQTLHIDFEKFLNLRPVTFDYIQGDKGNIGFIAEEVAKLFPELVIFTKLNDSPKIPANIKYDKFVTLAVAAVQKLSDKIIKLEKELADLKKSLT